MRYVFEYLANLAKTNKFKIVVAIFPYLVGNANNYLFEIAQEIVTMEAERVGFDVIDLVDDFTEVGMTNLRITRDDVTHPNHLDNKIVAEEIAKYIQSK
ncbi:MAG: hypothetical protein ABH859_03955 [Pseudomonadota bacterium]